MDASEFESSNPRRKKAMAVSAASLRPVPFRFTTKVGLGTWHYGERGSERRAEIAALLGALEAGYKLIDTAEMYAAGRAESLLGQALRAYGAGKRAQLQIVSKLLPSNASADGTVRACEQSLKRLGCDYLDLYLLHWEGGHAFEATLEGMLRLHQQGRIRAWGVSNFDQRALARWALAEKRAGVPGRCAANQIYYSLLARGAEFDLLPAMQEQTMPLMAYTPLGSGTLASEPRLKALAATRGLSAAQLALAWCLRQPDCVVIPKSSNLMRIRENLKAAGVSLDQECLKAIDAIYPPPRSKQALAML
jgi:diketogulonate reductase-like aldo/keto reductase